MASIVIPIKTNNQRLPGKNTMTLGDKPLYQHLFDTVKKCKNVDEIYVDSSDMRILQVARENGFKVIKRPDKLNSPETSGNNLINHAIQHIDDEIIGQFFVTTPFLKSTTIDQAFSILMSSHGIGSCFGLYPVHDRFWKDGKPLNHSLNMLVGTQYMQPVYREAGFYVFRKSRFIEEQSRITKLHTTFDVEPLECVDIDVKADFIYAQAVYENIWRVKE